MIQKILIAALVSIPLLNSCGTSKNAHELATLDEKKKIHIKMGETYNMKVKENLTTGYRWSYTTSQNCGLDIQDEHITDKHPPGMVGVGGDRFYTIKGTQKGECVISFFHSRSDKKDGNEIDSKTITFVVE